MHRGTTVRPGSHPLCHAGDLVWVPPPSDAPPGIRAGVSTRRGGVSRAPYASLNVGTRTGDDQACLAANLQRLESATGVALGRAARIHLAHGTRVIEATGPGLQGQADGLWTQKAALPLALTVADCLPLALAEPAGAIALIHCGWRGLAAGIAREAVAALRAQTASRPATWWAWIGPGIGVCCFAVGPEVAERFPAGVRRRSTKDAAEHVDLAAFLRGELLAAGMLPERIQLSGLCTSCEADLFFSHRRDGVATGRLLAWIERTA